MILKISQYSQIFTGKHLCWTLFLIKLQASKKDVLNIEYCKILKNSFFYLNTSDGCFCIITHSQITNFTISRSKNGQNDFTWLKNPLDAFTKTYCRTPGYAKLQANNALNSDFINFYEGTLSISQYFNLHLHVRYFADMGVWLFVVLFFLFLSLLVFLFSFFFFFAQVHVGMRIGNVRNFKYNVQCKLKNFLHIKIGRLPFALVFRVVCSTLPNLQLFFENS